MPPHPLANFEIQNIIKISQDLVEIIGRDNLPKIKDGTSTLELIGLLYMLLIMVLLILTFWSKTYSKRNQGFH